MDFTNSFHFKFFHIILGLCFIIQANRINGKEYVSSISENVMGDAVRVRMKRGVVSTASATVSPTQNTADKKPLVSQYSLGSSNQQAIVEWAGKDSQVVVCVTRDHTQNKNSATSTFISFDYGTTFKDRSDEFKVDGDKRAIIASFFKSEEFNDRFVFTDKVNKYLFVTLDYGHTLTAKKIDFSPSKVTFHPTNSMIFLVWDQEDKFKKLWITPNFGDNWVQLDTYVKSYFFSHDLSKPTLYVVRGESETVVGEPEYRVVAYDSLTDENNYHFRSVISNVQEFELKEDFLFAVKKKRRLFGEPRHVDTLQLWISYKDGPFLLSQFPNDLAHKNYYVADVSNGQIMVCVYHGISSNLYVSSFHSSSDESVKFSLSLERILYFSPNKNWNNTWLAKTSGKPFADIYRIKGMRGVFIASQLSASFSKRSHRLSPDHLTSFISYDQGGEWSLINPPTVDHDGNTVSCLKKNNCSLHISQELSKLHPATKSNTILTSKSAPGMIISSGTLGTSLKGHVSLYLSADAGVSWYEVLKGNYLYAFGDHGGVIVVVQHYHGTNLETDEILYSIDEGKSWHTHKFSSEKIRVYGLMTQLGENTTVFTLFGSQLQKHEWIIVKIDMKPVFNGACKPKDYKIWTPFDQSDKRHCLLGEQDSYKRRNLGANCFNGLNFDKPVSSQRCPCDRSDYECDYGFKVDKSDPKKKCVKDSTDLANPFAVPTSCHENSFYMRTKGYRKIPGDNCLGFVEEFEPEQTPCPIKVDMEFLLVSNRTSIFRYDMMNPSSGLMPLPLTDLRGVIALDFHMKNDCLYWSDVIAKKIMRQCFDGTHQQDTVLDKDIGNVEGLALDWVSNSLYFVDGDRKVIEMVKVGRPLIRGLRRVVLKQPDIVRPRAIALHVVRGYMFFTDWSSEKPMVARAYLDGSHVKVLFGSDVVAWPNGIAIDRESEKIVWADAKLKYIGSADLDGGNFKKIVTDQRFISEPFSVSIFKSTMYWVDWTKHGIFQTNKDTGENIVQINDVSINSLADMKVFGKYTQRGSNDCGEDKNNCQFFCFANHTGGYECLCPSWLKPIKRGSHNVCVCEDGSVPSATGACLTKGNTCSEGFFKCDNSFCVPNSMVCDMDNDCGDHSDEKNCEVAPCLSNAWRCKNGHCISLAWKCDSEDDCGDGSDEEGCVYPACPNDKFTCNNKRCIEKSWLCDLQDDCRDGSDELNCTYPQPQNRECSSLQFKCKSNGICLPSFWRCDSEKDCMDGSDEEDCESHQCNRFQFQCPSHRCIFQSWKCDGEDDCGDGADEADCPSTTPSPESKAQLPIWNVTRRCLLFEFRCGAGNCVPMWWRCDGARDCADGSDESGCHSTTTSRPSVTTSTSSTSTPTSFACREDQMECKNGDCIWEAWVCDGDKDCPSGEDEEHCEENRPCPSDHFRCWHSKGCIDEKLRCNGRPDCADGTDELGCALPTKNATVAPGTSKCPNGLFACDGGTCLPESKKCDQNNDCIDLTDESSCSDQTSPIYQASNLSPLESTNTSLSFKWEFGAKVNLDDFQFLPSCIVKAALGNPKAWLNATWIQNTSFEFKNLKPFTNYLLKVYVLHKSSRNIYPAAEMLTMTTDVGVPSPPTEVNVTQVLFRLQVTWADPHTPNGPAAGFKIFVASLPMATKEYLVGGSSHRFSFVPSQLNQKHIIWLTFSNTKFTSPESEPVVFEPLSVDQAVSGLKAVQQKDSKILVSWTPLKDVHGYKFSYVYPENQFMGTKFSKDVSGSQIEVENLAPGLKYDFRVSAYKGVAVGPSASVDFTTSGTKLPSLQNLTSKVLDSNGTSVQISWNEPTYKDKHPWQYKVLWGKTLDDLTSHTHMGTSKNTSFVVHHLDACEDYFIAVFISGPIGSGPATEFKVTTKEDKLAPPKALKTSVSNGTMNVSWQSPCPRQVDNSLRYLLSITEMTTNKTSMFDLPTKANQVTQNHWVRVERGGRYNVSIRTYLKGSRSSQPAVGVADPIPAPFELTYNPSDSSFFWRDAKNLPHDLLTENHSYVLYFVRADKGRQAEPDVVLEAMTPPFQVTSQLDLGQVYLASVAFKNKAGYLSERSQAIRVEEPIGDAVIVPSSSVVGVVVSVTVVIVILVAVVAVMAVRHKRLANSFAAFANSHYDHSQGTTRISTEQSLDEDDFPMIRGFSDDEPLVIA